MVALRLQPGKERSGVVDMRTLIIYANNYKNSTTGADASGKYQLAGIHKFINALTTHSA